MAGNPRHRNKHHRRKPQPRKKRVDPKKFWGDSAALANLADDTSKIKTSPRPDALISSLGRPPLSVAQAVAEGHFSSLYGRAVMLAGALAAAGDLVDYEDI